MKVEVIELWKYDNLLTQFHTYRHYSQSSTTHSDGMPTKNESSVRSSASAARTAAKSKSEIVLPSATTKVKNKSK